MLTAILVFFALIATVAASMIRRWPSLIVATVCLVAIVLATCAPADMGGWLQQVWLGAFALTLLGCAASWIGRKLVAQENDWGYHFRLGVILAPIVWIGVISFF
ncbi:hypothetical protein LOC68_24210 [Blastopirellula sp. JC732]|uniref:Uncharacterized protein n=1 Tax=Blastopirellula sediminis TaxID=2894196 RepID=A0A9X1SIP9_9BACT|nr:hypothetical protein [Blastopirellula sediminis]MCC9605188.1 hypothetical protein [Blastopirellula sediminis]MCC9631512.1 hypothetical protein [Blastopirellula sediminis]